MPDLCQLLTSSHSSDRGFSDYQLLANVTLHEEHLSLVNRIVYAYIAPIVIASGIIGDILTITTLTNPLMRRASIIYVYLVLLATTDLLMQCSIIPMVLYFLEHRLCSYWSALYYAHVAFPLVNAFMGASVWIVVFLTMTQYIAVCYPLYGDFLKSRRLCFSLFVAAYVINFCIYAPWAVKKAVYQASPELSQCQFVICDHPIETWFKVYEWIRETISRLIPFVLVAFFNVRILISYRIRKKNLQNKLAINVSSLANTNAEEKRLFVLFFSIIIIFFVCTVPAAPLTILVSDRHSRNLPFQIFRAVVNMIEVTKFALNFYFYCLINPGIRSIFWQSIRCRKPAKQALVKGQPVKPMIFYRNSNKSPPGVVTCSRSSTRRSDFTESRKSSVTTFGGSKAASLTPNENGDKAHDKLTVINESNSSISNEFVNRMSII